MAIRTDLALEAKALWEKSATKTTKLEGVIAREHESVTTVEIINEAGAKALGKPIGRYVTMRLKKYDTDVRKNAQLLARQMENMIELTKDESVLVVGLGNRAVTPDALGPQTVDKLFLTRHLTKQQPFDTCRAVSAIVPGVLATTGIETLETVRGVVAHVKPDHIIVVDALAAGGIEHLCSTVQLCDTGIAPGSGVGNRRAAFNEESLGAKVYALGVPTVVDAQTGSGMIVTPRDIDARIAYLSAVLSAAVNLLLHPELDYDDFAQIANFS